MSTPIEKATVPYTGAVCNYLGLQDDPGTSLAVPSLLNMCHRARPVEPVRLEHQRVFCQTTNHAQCPVFRADQGMRLPVEIRGRRLRSATRGPGPALWLLPIGVLLVAAIVFFVGRRWPYSLPPLGGLAEITSSLAPTSSVFPTLASTTEVQPLPPIILGVSSTDQGPLPTSGSPTPVRTSTASPPSASKPTRTPSPTVTRSATVTSTPLGRCGHQLEEAFGSSRRLVIHRIKGGESLNMFADRYYTTVDVIEGLNFELYVPIRNESVIVIAPGLRQTSVLPAFDTLEVQQPGATLSSLAAKVGVPLEALAEYNNFGPDCQTIVGWLVIPREVTPTP